jgi:hypothetical protein
MRGRFCFNTKAKYVEKKGALHNIGVDNALNLCYYLNANINAITN